MVNNKSVNKTLKTLLKEQHDQIDNKNAWKSTQRCASKTVETVETVETDETIEIVETVETVETL